MPAEVGGTGVVLARRRAGGISEWGVGEPGWG